jgi:UPF0176 protein
MENCCSVECQDIIHLPMNEQIRLRRGVSVGNKIFRKGKSDKLKFKHSGELSDVALAVASLGLKKKHYLKIFDFLVFYLSPW